MVRIELTETIEAPIERVFDLSRSIDLHIKTASRTHEQAIAGVTSGLIGPSQTVTWRGKHFGFWFTHTSRITKFERPYYFQDAMLRGSFKTYHHDHRFEVQNGRTRMNDVMEFEAPTALGRFVEKLFLEAHLRRFLTEHNVQIKRIAESEEWKRYLPVSSEMTQ